jgi:CubicO group peptidase (beta-lactamase class C family)
VFRLLLYAASLISVQVSAQSKNIVVPDNITSALHRQHTGLITFMQKAIPFEQYTENDFAKAVELNDKNELYIRVFMDNSLTNYLHEAAPSLTAEELAQKGNFRFTFIVDGRVIYTENLNPGAGTAQSKNKLTVFRVPLVTRTNEDSWGRFLWNRFMMHGGDQAFSPGTHQLKIEMSSYVNNPQPVTGKLIASGSVSVRVPARSITAGQRSIQPVKPGSGWPVSSHRYDSTLIMQLNEKIADRTFKDITSIVVIRNGELLLEEYFNGAGRNTMHDTRSVGKSFASAITGIAISDGHIKDEHQRLGSFYNLSSFANYSPQKDSVTIESLLTMSSGFSGSDQDPSSPGNEEKMYPSPNWVSFVLNLPMYPGKTTGTDWEYFTGGVVLLGDILDKRVPGGLEKYAAQKLFAPLGITTFRWQYTPQKAANTAGSLAMRSLDYARFGQLYRNKGIWNGVQVLPQQWVEASLAGQVVLPGNESYGYLFWNKKYTANGNSYEVSYASGNGGNKIIIFKDQPLVVVITSTAYNKPYGHLQADRIVEQYILPAMVK